jgi:hypothetical protein
MKLVNLTTLHIISYAIVFIHFSYPLLVIHLQTYTIVLPKRTNVRNHVLSVRMYKSYNVFQRHPYKSIQFLLQGTALKILTLKLKFVPINRNI